MDFPSLDTFVYKEDRKLKTKVYHKPTDNKQYLLYTSCHPKQQINSIPYSLLVRAKIICTKEEDFITEAKSIITKLRKRKYPEKILRTAVERITTINREDLLQPKEKKEDSRIRYIITFNPSNPRIKEITATNIHLLARNEKERHHIGKNSNSISKIQEPQRLSSNRTSQQDGTTNTKMCTLQRC